VAKAVEGRVSPTALLHVSYYDMSFFARIFGLEDAEETRERVEELRVAVRRLDEEWTEVYGKFRVLQMRVAKQVQRREENSSHEEPQGAESDGNNGIGDNQTFSLLSPHQQRLQREIMARRNRKEVKE